MTAARSASENPAHIRSSVKSGAAAMPTSPAIRWGMARATKSDIQPLINQGASKNDICASIFGAVVNQTVAGLAQGQLLHMVKNGQAARAGLGHIHVRAT